MLKAKSVKDRSSLKDQLKMRRPPLFFHEDASTNSPLPLRFPTGHNTDVGLKSPLRLLLFSLSSLILMACQSDPAHDFTELEPGMDKAHVLGVMGSPQRTQRNRGQDRWTYIFYNHMDREEKEVHFQDNRAVYLGNPIPPTISAEAQDAMNANDNAEVDRLAAQHRQQFRHDYQKYQQEADDSKQIRYVPQFEPIR